MLLSILSSMSKELTVEAATSKSCRKAGVVRYDCLYVDLLLACSKNQMGRAFDGDTPYLIMFGPDICGGKKKVHLIIWHNDTNHMTLEDIKCKSDQLTHVYTLYITPENEYKVNFPSANSSNVNWFRCSSTWKKSSLAISLEVGRLSRRERSRYAFVTVQ